MEKDKDKGVKLKAEDVLHALDELSTEEFDKFKWYLQQPDSLPDRVPPLRKARLERAKSLNIVDLMVQTYTLQRSMEVTLNILKKINRNDLLQRLSLEKEMCPEHIKPLELFCVDDKIRVCRSCSEHENHNVVPFIKEYEGNKPQPRKRNNEINKMIKSREVKIKEIREIMQTSKDGADREKQEAVLTFAALHEAAKRGMKELIKEIEDKRKTTDKEGEDFIKDLEQEISELMKMKSHVNFLQRFSALEAAPPTKNWTEVRVHPPSFEGTVVRAVGQLKDSLWEDMKKMLKLKRVQQYAVDVTLDPDTANPWLILSDDGKQVKHGDVWKELPDNPERFTEYVFVLGQQSFSSGRFYFEVQVKGKTDWDLGVARESVERKGDVDLSTKDGFWVIVLRDGNRYSTGNDSSVRLHLQPGPEKVGVFVDYEEGLVSFYDVDAAALIYSFTGCCFTQKIYPLFSPSLNYGGQNSAPLIIC